MPILNRSKVLTAMPLFYASPHPGDAVSLILYQRDDCQLCDLALEVLAVTGVPEFESVFIDGDETLEVRYGLRVPVLRDANSGLELDWPFDATTLSDRLHAWRPL